MHKLCCFLLFSCITGVSWADAPPVNNTVPPCDNSAITRKPSCNMDSDSIKAPPETPQQKRVREKGVVVPPEIPAEGLPNREPNRAPPPKGEGAHPDPALEKNLSN